MKPSTGSCAPEWTASSSHRLTRVSRAPSNESGKRCRSSYSPDTRGRTRTRRRSTPTRPRSWPHDTWSSWDTGGYCTSPGPQVNEAQDRERGYRVALAEVNAAPLPVLRGDWSAQSGFEAGSGVDVQDFPAVFSGNDQVALGCMNALRCRGLVAPADYSIAGVDDMPDARHFAPPLTTVWMDFIELGRAGFRMLVERITTGKRVARQVIRPHLVARESSARVAPDSEALPATE